MQTLFGTQTGKLLRSSGIQRSHPSIAFRVPQTVTVLPVSLLACYVMIAIVDRIITSLTIVQVSLRECLMRELAVCAPCLCLTLKFQKSQGANADSENHCCELGLVAIALANQKRNQASQSNLSAEFLSDSEQPLCLEHIAMFSYFFNCLLGLSLN